MTQDRSAPGEAKASDPKFEHVADVLRMEISDGQYRYGQRIPTQRELVQRFAVSRDTVRRALQDLQHEGWIESRQGSGAVVARRPSHQAGASSPMVHLKPYIEEAFEAPTVTLDLMTLTAESMDAHIRAQTLRIHSEEIKPQRIAVRLLLPSTDINLALPRSVDDPNDERPRDRHRMLTKRHAGALRDAILELRNRDLVEDVSVEIRTMPLTPIAKLYIINRRHALFGMYRVVKRPVDVRAADDSGRTEKLEIFDVMGLGATLFPFTGGDTETVSQDATFVDHAQRWFDSLWDHLAHDARFDD
ncbi:GntR family transcriptional regulator [Streptomyces sp. NPDC047108]|uniref:winged helix-turn-helix domain-containing protein n=1 Tax=Streptomyces sp. NPDC047108 TaxID=3155025 RepID=UPI0033E3E662